MKKTHKTLTVTRHLKDNKSKAISSLSLFLVKMIAKLERTQSIEYKNKDQHRTPHKQWEIHKTIENQQQNYRFRTDSSQTFFNRLDCKTGFSYWF